MLCDTLINEGMSFLHEFRLIALPLRRKDECRFGKGTIEDNKKVVCEILFRYVVFVTARCYELSFGYR